MYFIVPTYASTKVHGLKRLQKNVANNFSVKAFGKMINFKVSVNKGFVADTHTTEFVEKDGNITKYLGVLGEFSFGVVDDDPHSHVALHHTAKGVVSRWFIMNELP